MRHAVLTMLTMSAYLTLETKKKPPGEAVFSKVKSVGELLNLVTGFSRAQIPNTVLPV